MKTRHLLLSAGLALLAASSVSAAPKENQKPDNVIVTFKDPDNFTDAAESGGTDFTSQGILDELATSLQESATRLLPEGQKLTVTVTDVDLSGDTRLNPNHIRVATETQPPRIELTFQLTDASGKVLKEGTRRLTNQDYLRELKVPPFTTDPLYHEKALLREWAKKELKPAP